MKVLMVGQLPKEIGGNYTTGAANVVFELSKKKNANLLCYTYGTNIRAIEAKRHSSYEGQYIGYRNWFSILSTLCDWIISPLKTYKQWKHYMKVDHENPFRYASYKSNIESAIKKVSPDIIHVHSIGNLSPTRFACGKKNIPILLTCHGIFYRGEKQDTINRDKYLGNIGMADAYSGLTLESLNEYQNYLNISKNRVTVIPNGVDCEKFYYDKNQRDKIRNQYAVPDNTIVFITVASVQERKGQYRFVQFLSKLQNVDFQYWIIGDGADVERIKNYIRDNQMEGKVKLMGFHASKELYAFYSASDIYAHVSTQEGQALCEIEASATGLKCLVSEEIVGTIPDLSSGDYHIVDFESPDYEKLMSWLSKKTENRMSLKTLDWGNISLRYASLYQSILKKC